ncbi:MAG: glycerophosphodiester phosphodiesterase [Candidatus Bipolaricaulia bacterium]
MSNTSEHNIKVIAHRGASGHAPENTATALSQAIAFGADIVEIDIHPTRDGHWVLLHDPTLNRTTNGSGEVRDATLEEIERLDAGSWFDASFRGEKLLTLKQAIDTIPDSIELIVDIKATLPEDTALQGLLRLLDQRQRLATTLLASPDERVHERLKRLDRSVQLSLSDPDLNRPNVWEKVERLEPKVISLHWTVANHHAVTQIHRHGIAVITWTVNEPDRMEHMIELGVDGITTDFPDRLMTVLGRRAH